MLSAYRVQAPKHTHTPDSPIRDNSPRGEGRPDPGMLDKVSKGSCEPDSVSGRMGGRREVNKYGEGGGGGGGGGGG